MEPSIDILLKAIRKELLVKADEKIRLGARRFVKEEIKLYGLKAAEIHRISKSYFKQIKDKPKIGIFKICEELWQSGFHEEGIIACRFSYFIHKQYKPEDIDVFENWIANYVTNWALCDTLCNHNVGTLISMYPEKIDVLKKWAMSTNRWMRRAAAVSLIVPGKQGKFLKDIFGIADILLTDNDDLVQKGYGWMLKVTSQACQKEVFKYVMHNKDIMPRTALRYAIEKMPSELKTMAMSK